MERLAVQILQYARNELLVALRFMDLALCKLTYQAADVTRTATDGKRLYFSPQYIFQLYREGGYILNHTYLHSVFHCVFYHPFIDPRVDQPLWDLACDIAVEGILRELNVKQLETEMDAARAAELDALQKAYGKLTAERLYKSFLKKPPSQKERERLRELFQVDEHMVWYMEEMNIQITLQGSGGGEDQDEDQGSSGEGQDDGQDEDQRSGGEDQDDGENLYPSWEEISGRIKVDLETASQEWGKRSSSLMQNVQEVNRERYDYSGFLRKFAVLGEAMQINDDEFDYIFYTYGLSLYDAAVSAHKKKKLVVQENLRHLFEFVEEVYSEGQELMILVTELTVRYYCAKFIAKFGCPEYFKHNQDMLFHERRDGLLKEIDALSEALDQ